MFTAHFRAPAISTTILTVTRCFVGPLEYVEMPLDWSPLVVDDELSFPGQYDGLPIDYSGQIPPLPSAITHRYSLGYPTVPNPQSISTRNSCPTQYDQSLSSRGYASTMECSWTTIDSSQYSCCARTKNDGSSLELSCEIELSLPSLAGQLPTSSSTSRQSRTGSDTALNQKTGRTTASSFVDPFLIDPRSLVPSQRPLSRRRDPAYDHS